MKRIILTGLLGIMAGSVAEAGAIGRMLFGPRRHAGGGGCYGASYASQASYGSACGAAMATPPVRASGCYGSSYGAPGAPYAVPAPMVAPPAAPMPAAACPGGVCPTVARAPDAPPSPRTPVPPRVRLAGVRIPAASEPAGVAIPADPGGGGVAIPFDLPETGRRLARTRG
jgi:hypothetical protein